MPLPALTQAVTFQLKVTDNLVPGGDKNQTSNGVTTTVYALPGANAGMDAHANENTVVGLSGSATRGTTRRVAKLYMDGVRRHHVFRHGHVNI